MRIDSAVHVKGKGKLHGAQATSDARIIPRPLPASGMPIGARVVGCRQLASAAPPPIYHDSTITLDHVGVFNLTFLGLYWVKTDGLFRTIRF